MNVTTPAAPSQAQPTAARRGVAFMGFSTESSHGVRADWTLVDIARDLRRRGVPCVLLQVHLHATDEQENSRRIDELVARVIDGQYKWAICSEVWTAELGRRLLDAGVQVVERRSRSLPETIFCQRLENLPLEGCSTGAPLDEYQGLVEVLGQPKAGAIANVDLSPASLGHSCSYKSSISDNPFFAEIAGEPEFAVHKGCAYCFNSMSPAMRSVEVLDARAPEAAGAILDEVRLRRATLPGLKTIWIPFAEVLFEAVGGALDRSQDDPVWRGLTLAMQCRPDVVVQRRKDIEALAAKAHDAGTVLKIAVVGYENFSPAEIQVLNRGVTPDDLAAAAAILGGWQREPILGLDVRDYVPSFILFTPWTTLEDLELNLREIDRNGLTNANVERLRLGRATPLYEMARRQGLTSSEPVRLAVHPNGYFSEAAIRFKDPRVESACEGFDRLKPLAFEAQAPLLAAIVDAVRRSPDPSTIDWAAIEATWERIKTLANENPHRSRPDGGPSIDVRRVREVLARNGIAPSVKPSDLPTRSSPARSARPATEGQIRLAVGAPCNNGCEPCVWARRLSFGPEVSSPLPPVAGKRVLLAGREPTMREGLPELVRELRGAGAGRVEIHTNGRRFLYPRFVRALDVAGLDSVVVKLFGPNAAAWDAHTREPGSFAQTVEGMAVLAQVAPGITLGGMIFSGRDEGSRLGEMIDFTRSLGLARVVVVLRLAQQDLLALGDLEGQVRAVQGTDDGPRVYFSVE
jgi:hypothetical protein